MKNYLKLFTQEIDKVSLLKQKPTLLLHTCCAMCFSASYMQLKDYFDISVYFYNPNIYPLDEYIKRKNEVIRVIDLFNKEFSTNVKFIEENDTFDYYKVKKVHKVGCFDCFHLRILKSFEYANNNGFDYFTTTLTLGRLKNSYLINSIGESLQPLFMKTKYLFSDFKKNKGIDVSLEMKEKYNIYAQCYCGCEPYYNEK